MRHALNRLGCGGADWCEPKSGGMVRIATVLPLRLRLPNQRCEREALAETIGQDGFDLWE